MAVEQKLLSDVTEAAQRILRFVVETPPHVRPWLRGIEAEAEHIHVEVVTANRRASARFLSWLVAGLEEEPADE